ncbi:uncharacterized protein LOC121728408 [Aricia agestis]|uniref:uncharacterized protein LOC121728408 n=1 Tax=Aricia agestis TaxID=91739 RepID=UPI001C204A25|nr:uncharacterized protein LOC121728408 [Aricia agestis]
MMKFFIFLLLACYAVWCDDSSNYYIVERPADDPPVKASKAFNVYWNVPTMQCKSKGILFSNLYEKYGIVQNQDDQFRGEKITILYEPGLFPAIFKNESSGKYRFRNGGVPQEGDIQEHLTVFRKDMEEGIPNVNFDGIGIIDFESWRPSFRQNFGTLVPYKDVSYEIESKLHPWWPKAWVESEAKRRFEEAARKFMQTTISVAKQMRPKAKWGYYGFPHCFNMAQSNMAEDCSSEVRKENDQTYWLWSESSALYPSVYRSHDLTSSQLAAMVRGRVKEAARVRRSKTVILPYFWFRYRDGGFLTEADLSAAINTMYKSDASGFIIWGSSNDVNTVQKCEKLLKYVENTFGPAIASYTKKSNKQDDEYEDTPEETYNTESDDYTTETMNKVTTLKVNTSYINNNAPTYYELKDKIDPEMVWNTTVKDPQESPSNFNEQIIENENSVNSNTLDLHNYNASIMYDILMGTFNIFKQESINNVSKSYVNTPKQNKNSNPKKFLKNEHLMVDSDIKINNVINVNTTNYDEEQDYNNEYTTPRNVSSEVTENFSSDTTPTTISINSYTSIESLENNSTLSYSETFKDFTSVDPSAEDILAIDSMDPKDEYIIFIDNEKSYNAKQASTGSTVEDVLYTGTESNAKRYVDFTTEKPLDTRFFEEKETYTTEAI